MTVTEAWWQLTEVRMAERLAEGDAGRFFELLVGIVDSGVVRRLHDELRSLGLTIDDLLEMRSEATSEDRLGRRLGPKAHAAVRRLFLKSFTPEQIARMLGLEDDLVLADIARTRTSLHAIEIVELHNAGRSVPEIMRATGAHRQTVLRTLAGAGLEPRSVYQRLDADQRQRIVDAIARGATPAQVAADMDVPIHAVRNTVRSARKKGLLR